MSSDPDHADIPSHPASPLDPFLLEALAWLREREHPLASEVAGTMAHYLGWPVGFAETIINALQVNRLFTTSPWEPGKLHITRRGMDWLGAIEMAAPTMEQGTPGDDS